MMIMNKAGFLNIILVLSIGLMLIGIVVGVYLIGVKTNIFSHASSSNYPDKVSISNITDTSFTVSWYTPNGASHQFLSYGTGSDLGSVAEDDRGSAPSYLHYVTLTKLSSNTNYFLKVGADEQSPVFQQSTGPTLPDTAATSAKISGQILTPDSIPPNEAIVYLLTDEGQLLSTLAKQGVWSVELRKARIRDLSDYLSVKPSSVVEMYAQTDLKGAGYLSAFAFGKDQPQNILLGEGRVPFYKIQLGSNKISPDSTPKTSASGNQAVTQNNTPGIMDVLWVGLTGQTK